MKLNLNFDKYKGKTRLREWWREVKKHFEAVQTAHNDLENSFGTEVTQRINADVALSDRINAEEQRRADRDTTLTNDLATEAQTRLNRDNELQRQISNINQADIRADLYGDEVEHTFKAVFPKEIPYPYLTQEQSYYGERLTVDNPNVEIYIDDKPVTFKTAPQGADNVISAADDKFVMYYDTTDNTLKVYPGPTENITSSYRSDYMFILALYNYSNIDFEYKLGDTPTGGYYILTRCFCDYISPNADTTGETYTIEIKYRLRRTRDDLLTENKASFLDAVNENAEAVKTLKNALPNIKKNPDAEDGDIIDTHMTVGTRAAGEYGDGSFSSGTGNVASAPDSCVDGGFNNQAIEANAFVGGGENNIASETNAFVGGGHENEVDAEDGASLGGRRGYSLGPCAVTIGGVYAKANKFNVAFGHHNIEPTGGTAGGKTGDALIIGNGTLPNKSNAFRVTYDGNVYCDGEYSNTGADYAEMFEWADGNPENEDRRGLFAYIENGKMRLASAEDTDKRRLGVISARPAVVGDDYDDSWCGKYLTDIYGAVLTQVVHYEAEECTVMVKDPETGERVPKTGIIEAYDAEEPILNPDYDPEREYIPRAQRKEYDCWAFLGTLYGMTERVRRAVTVIPIRAV